jgi:hypothetical membrane protein
MSELTQVELSSPVFARARWVAAISAVLSLWSMWEYPGGTSLNARTAGYSLTQNFLSDLGMTVAYNGEANGLGAALFAASMLVMVAGCGAVVWRYARLYAMMPESRRLARAASAVGALVCASFVGVAFTPENRVMPLHVDFTLFAFRAAPLAMVLLAVASFRASRLPRAMAVTWVALTAVLVAYVVLLAVGPSTSTAMGLATMVLAQKLVTVVAGGLLLLQCAHALRYGERHGRALR